MQKTLFCDLEASLRHKKNQANIVEARCGRVQEQQKKTKKLKQLQSYVHWQTRHQLVANRDPAGSDGAAGLQASVPSS